ncbi:MAG: PKD repeat protein [Flavobacteriales bacterium]|jgi:PKD repeat protein
MDKVREIIKAILLVCILLNVSSLAAQGTQVKTLFSIKNKKTISPECFSDELHTKLMTNDVKYKERHEALEESIQKSVANGGANKNSILTVPLVVHVIHTGEVEGTGTNISDEQVLSAVAALNEDYRKAPGSNGDGAGVDSEIEFCLAVRDPNGNPTSGIVRVDGSFVTNYATEGISIGQGSGATETTIKALSKWPKADYYNIWIVNEIDDNDGGSGVQGYAYFSSASAAVDGSVILYNAFGTVGNLKGYTNMNRTTTHELGHAFNLYHSFEGESCDETDCSTSGDRVCDTPPTSLNTSCASASCTGAILENYMDYTSQTCKDMFTDGQKTRMRATLTGARGSLLESEGCTPVSQFDAGLVEVVNPTGNNCSQSITPTVRVRNFGSTTINSLNITYSMDGGSTSTFNYSGTIDDGETVAIDLPVMNVSIGSHSLSVTVSSPNGQQDEFAGNDQGSSSFSVVTGSTLTVTVKQDVYGSDTSWELFDNSGNVIASDGPFANGESGVFHVVDVCMAEGCYTFSIYDSYGDGLIGSAYYEVSDSEQGLIVTGSDYSTEETTTFCLDGGSTTGTAPTAEFSANMTGTCAGESLSFTDMSSDTPTSWSWVFEGASNPVSSNQNPTGITYDTPGIYDVTLTVSNASGSSTETKSNYISIGNGPSVSANIIDVSCNGESDGSISLNVTGSGSETYSWSHGSTSQNVNNLTAGVYSVLVTDGDGCQAMEFFVVEEPDEIIISLTNISSDIDNAGIGSATVTVTGGMPSYNYSWSNGNLTSNIQNVTAGDYEITVIDGNGCMSSLELVITNQDSNSNEPPVADFMVNSNDVCAQGTLNFVDLSTNVPTSWLWDFPGATPSTSNLKNPMSVRYNNPGAYDVSLTVTNGAGTTTKTMTNYIQTLASPIVQLTSTNVTCNGLNDASADLTVTGTNNNSYIWSNGNSTEDISGLSAGAYNVIVTSDVGCSTTETLTITEPSPLLMSVIGIQPDSCDLGQGQVTVVPNGGIPNYTIQWNDPAEQVDFNLNNLMSGSYVAILTDANGCSKGASVDIGNIDCGTVGIEELSDVDLTVYPNPFDGSQISLLIRSQNDIFISIYDITGSETPVNITNNGGGEFEIIPQNNMANGLYMLRIVNGENTIVKKIVVKK